MAHKLDLYRNVHKAQRVRLFSLAVELGRADYNDHALVDALCARLNALVAELREHAGNEDRFIHPLLRVKAPETAAALDRGHDDFEEQLRDFQARASRLPLSAGSRTEEGLDLYRAFWRAISLYLAHLQEEETVAMPALWETCGEEELLEVMRSFVASRTDSQRLGDLLEQLPALTPQERTAYLRAATRGDRERASSILEKLRGRMAEPELHRLAAELAI